MNTDVSTSINICLIVGLLNDVHNNARYSNVMGFLSRYSYRMIYGLMLPKLSH